MHCFACGRRIGLRALGKHKCPPKILRRLEREERLEEERVENYTIREEDRRTQFEDHG